MFFTSEKTRIFFDFNFCPFYLFVGSSTFYPNDPLGFNVVLFRYDEKAQLGCWSGMRIEYTCVLLVSSLANGIV